VTYYESNQSLVWVEGKSDADHSIEQHGLELAENARKEKKKCIMYHGTLFWSSLTKSEKEIKESSISTI
jgi:hypothetical protein